MASVIYKDDFIEITRESGLLYIKSNRQGMNLELFNKIMKDTLPNVKITNFNAIKNALLNAPTQPAAFGEERQRINISISDDVLKAYMTLYVTSEDLSPINRTKLVKEIIDALAQAGVNYGIKTMLLAGDLKSGIEYLVAEGLPAINGEDAKIKLYEIAAPQPQIIDSGNVNHYELNLINRVNIGDWLGERMDPTPGFPGKNVRGKEIPPIPGRNLPLLYDRISVKEEYKDGITTLLSKKNGAVYYKGDTIGVYDYLEIKGDINFSTGNIDFDGFLSVKGTIEDNFSVVANKDIEILGDYGVGAADKITSREGNVYIKGGIAGKNKAIVRCHKNLYVKYLSDITVECEGSVYIGFYCMNSNIRAKQVIVDSPRGRISGGQIDAEIRVSAAEIGTRAETRTMIRVRGFDRNSMKTQLDEAIEKMNEAKNAISVVKQHLQVYGSTSDLSPEQRKNFEDLRNRYADIKDELKELEYTYKNLNEYLKTPGDGAVIAKTRIYPKVRVEIKGQSEEILKEAAMITYYNRDNHLQTL